jgi:hypothetical protein
MPGDILPTMNSDQVAARGFERDTFSKKMKFMSRAPPQVIAGKAQRGGHMLAISRVSN